MKVNFEQFCADYDVALVVVSRDRAQILKKRADKLLDGYHLFYCGEGYEDYEYCCVERHEMSRGIEGLSAVRNYVLDVLPHRVVIFVDDDLKMIYYVSGEKTVRLSKEHIKLVFIDLVIHSEDQRSKVFGLSAKDIRKTSPLEPFRLRAVFGTVIGVIGRDMRFDERNMLKTDYDFCLQSMVKDRIIHLDQRYFASASKDAVAGGNMSFRTQERREKEIENLISWWGEDIIFLRDNKNNESLKVVVP